MTSIKLYGILEKKFGSTIKINVNKIENILNAIDSIKKNFRKKINDLHKEGKHYCLIFEKEKKIIHILPYVCGSGSGFMRFLGYVLQVVGFVLMFTPFFWVGIGLSVVGAGLTGYGEYLAAMEKIKYDQAYISVGGASSSAEAKGRSYVFSNRMNVASQGAIVPIGYGLLLTGSFVLNIALQSYNTNYSFSNLNVEPSLLLND